MAGGLGQPQPLDLESRENWGPILTVGTGDPGDVEPGVVLDLLRTAYRDRMVVGVDTEFACDLDYTTRRRSVLHLASLGIAVRPEHAVPAAEMVGGFHAVPLAQRVVLGRGSLEAFRKWFASDHRKVFFAASVDLHTLENCGVTVSNWVDILPYSRYRNPDGDEHGLKHHITRTLGYRGEGEYRELFRRPKMGTKGQPLKTFETIPIHEIVPGHELWETMKRYAALDAKATAELYGKWKAEGM